MDLWSHKSEMKNENKKNILKIEKIDGLKSPNPMSFWVFEKRISPKAICFLEKLKKNEHFVCTITCRAKPLFNFRSSFRYQMNWNVTLQVSRVGGSYEIRYFFVKFEICMLSWVQNTVIFFEFCISYILICPPGSGDMQYTK